jgi:hypothetical protein
LKRFQASRPGERLSLPCGAEDFAGFALSSSVTSTGVAVEGVGGVMMLRALRVKAPQGVPYGLRGTFSTQFIQGQQNLVRVGLLFTFFASA